MRKIIAGFTFAVFSMSLPVPPLDAQQDAGSISGTVSDSSRAVVPGVMVKLVNAGTDYTRIVTTGRQGEYIFTPLPAGTYQIILKAPGFKPEGRGPLELQVQQRLNIDVSLQVGSTTEQVTVQSAGVALQTEDSSVGQVVGSREIKDLPLNGRNVYQLVTITPGVAVDGAGRAVLAGQTAQNQYYGLDGVDNNNYSGILAGGPASLSPSPDTVEEFKVQTGNYSAEFGQSAGGVVNVVTKSGTNQYHGVGYEYFRNAALDAKTYFLTPGESKAPFNQNQYGGTMGGPILKNKLFFFASIEEFRSTSGNTSSTPLPPAAWQKGDFSSYLTGSTYRDTCTGAQYDTGQLFDPTSSHTATCLDGSTATITDPIAYKGHANTIDPGKASAAATKIIALFPTPCSTCGDNYVWSPVNVFSYTRGNGKIDYQWGRHDRITGHYSINDQPTTGTSNLPGALSPGTTNIARQQAVIFGDTHVFSSNVVNELRYSWAHNKNNSQLGGTGLDASSVGLGGIPYQPGLLGGLPSLSFSDVGASYGASQWTPQISEARDNQISDALTVVRGRHSFKFGGAYNRYGWMQFISQQPTGSYSFNGSLTRSATPLPPDVQQQGTAAVNGSGFAQFLYGLSDVNGLSSGITSNNWRNTGSVFAQDDWKVTPNLTVNAGLRWEFGTALHEKENRVAGIDLANGAFTIPKSRKGVAPYLPAGLPVEYVDSNTLMQPHQLNFGPRLGFSYKVTPTTVVRAAAGIFFANPFPAGVLGYPLNPPFGAAVQGPNVLGIDAGFPSDYLTNFNPTQLAIELYQLKPNYPTTNSWNFSVQQALAYNTLLDVAYVGSTSTHVNAGRDQNQPTPSAESTNPQARRKYPNLGILGDVLNSANGNYNSLQVKFEKRYSQGLSFLLAYTWAHSLDDAPSNITLAENGYDFYRDATNPQIDYGNSYFDIRQRTVFNALYLLPVGKGHAFGGSMPGWANMIVGGWQAGAIVAYQTGFHFAAITYNDPSNSDVYTYAGAAYPNVIGKVQDYSSCPGGHQSINCWFNPNAFGPSNPGEFGNEARNSLVGPNNFDMDMSMIKNVPITDKYRVQIRAEAFNLTNHPNLGLPNNVVESGSFGHIYGVGSQRQIQLAVRFEY